MGDISCDAYDQLVHLSTGNKIPNLYKVLFIFFEEEQNRCVLIRVDDIINIDAERQLLQRMAWMKNIPSPTEWCKNVESDFCKRGKGKSANVKAYGIRLAQFQSAAHALTHRYPHLPQKR